LAENKYRHLPISLRITSDLPDVRLDPETRFIIVGDASMAPYELMATDGLYAAMARHQELERRVHAGPGQTSVA